MRTNNPIYVYGGVKQDYAEAVKWYRKAVEQGLAEAQNNLVVMYNQGQGGKRNLTEAAKWWTKSAEKGYPYAQAAFRFSYSHGRGMPI